MSNRQSGFHEDSTMTPSNTGESGASLHELNKNSSRKLLDKAVPRNGKSNEAENRNNLTYGEILKRFCCQKKRMEERPRKGDVMRCTNSCLILEEEFCEVIPCDEYIQNEGSSNRDKERVMCTKTSDSHGNYIKETITERICCTENGVLVKTKHVIEKCGADNDALDAQAGRINEAQGAQVGRNIEALEEEIDILNELPDEGEGRSNESTERGTIRINETPDERIISSNEDISTENYRGSQAPNKRISRNSEALGSRFRRSSQNRNKLSGRISVAPDTITDKGDDVSDKNNKDNNLRKSFLRPSFLASKSNRDRLEQLEKNNINTSDSQRKSLNTRSKSPEKNQNNRNEGPERNQNSTSESTERNQANTNERPEKNQNNRSENLEIYENDRIDSPERNQNNRSESPQRNQNGKSESPERSQNNRVESQERNQNNRSESTESSQNNRVDSPERNQSNRSEIPEKSQNNRMESPERNQNNGSESPDRSQNNRMESPERNQNNESESPDRSQNNRMESPERNQNNRIESPERNPKNKSETPEKNQTYRRQSLAKSQANRRVSPEKIQTNRRQSLQKSQTKRRESPEKNPTNRLESLKTPINSRQSQRLSASPSTAPQRSMGPNQDQIPYQVIRAPQNSCFWMDECQNNCDCCCSCGYQDCTTNQGTSVCPAPRCPCQCQEFCCISPSTLQCCLAAHMRAESYESKQTTNKMGRNSSRFQNFSENQERNNDSSDDDIDSNSNQDSNDDTQKDYRKSRIGEEQTERSKSMSKGNARQNNRSRKTVMLPLVYVPPNQCCSPCYRCNNHQPFLLPCSVQCRSMPNGEESDDNNEDSKRTSQSETENRRFKSGGERPLSSYTMKLLRISCSSNRLHVQPYKTSSSERERESSLSGSSEDYSSQTFSEDGGESNISSEEESYATFPLHGGEESEKFEITSRKSVQTLSSNDRPSSVGLICLENGTPSIVKCSVSDGFHLLNEIMLKDSNLLRTRPKRSTCTETHSSKSDSKFHIRTQNYKRKGPKNCTDTQKSTRESAGEKYFKQKRISTDSDNSVSSIEECRCSRKLHLLTEIILKDSNYRQNRPHICNCSKRTQHRKLDSQHYSKPNTLTTEDIEKFSSLETRESEDIGRDKSFTSTHRRNKKYSKDINDKENVQLNPLLPHSDNDPLSIAKASISPNIPLSAEAVLTDLTADQNRSQSGCCGNKRIRKCDSECHSKAFDSMSKESEHSFTSGPNESEKLVGVHSFKKTSTDPETSSKKSSQAEIQSKQCEQYNKSFKVQSIKKDEDEDEEEAAASTSKNSPNLNIKSEKSEEVKFVHSLKKERASNKGDNFQERSSRRSSMTVKKVTSAHATSKKNSDNEESEKSIKETDPGLIRHESLDLALESKDSNASSIQSENSRTNENEEYKNEVAEKSTQTDPYFMFPYEVLTPTPGNNENNSQFASTSSCESTRQQNCQFNGCSSFYLIAIKKYDAMNPKNE